MHHHYADDGRILTPPKELKPLLKNAFPAFIKLLGHIRFFYMADEIWDGKSTLVFSANDKNLAIIRLEDDVFHILVMEDKDFRITDATILEGVFETLKNKIPNAFHRPFEQLTANPDPNVFPCGYRCDMCLGYQCYNKLQVSGSDNFVYMNWVCYNNCITEDLERPLTSEKGKGVFCCSGCNLNRNKFCRSYACSKNIGKANCSECGEYHTCDIYRGSHYAGQCNLGITAEEILKLVIPYCMKERLDIIRESAKSGSVFI